MIMNINFTSKINITTNLSETPPSYVPPRFDYTYNKFPTIVTSFGILAFAKTDYQYNSDIQKLISRNEYPPDVRLLMIQRRNTMGYIDFIRGRQFYNDDNILKRYLSEMTCDERSKLETMSFDELWEDMWYNKNSKPFKQDRKKSKEKFNTLDIASLLRGTFTKYTHTEFGIPKGRKNQKETDIQCAIREFNEETGYSEDFYTLLDTPPLIERFTGTNNVQYRHVYYYAIMNNDKWKIPIINPNNHKQLEEVCNLEFLYEGDITHLIRDYDIEKLKVIQEGFKNARKIYIKDEEPNTVFLMDKL